MKYTLESECAPCGFEEFARSCYENGNTPEEAIKMFQQKLLGKRLVYNPGGDCEPRYFVAPNAWQ
jgi:hypothetical protein